MKNQYILPISIVVVGVLIAGAVLLISRGPSSTSGQTGATATLRHVDATDHIYGNPKAPVMVVEYADLECPFCKDFEATMDQLMQYYGPSGNVAWVFRNFPLTPIHSKAPIEAQAAECAADQGGSAAFFKFIDAVYKVTPGENNLDLTLLPKIATQIGLDGDKLQQCVSSGTNAAKVQQQYNEAMADGLQGTPHIAIFANGEPVLSLDGNQPYSSMRDAIDQTLQAIGKSATSTTAQ